MPVCTPLTQTKSGSARDALVEARGPQHIVATEIDSAIQIRGTETSLDQYECAGLVSTPSKTSRWVRLRFFLQMTRTRRSSTRYSEPLREAARPRPTSNCYAHELLTHQSRYNACDNHGQPLGNRRPEKTRSLRRVREIRRVLRVRARLGSRARVLGMRRDRPLSKASAENRRDRGRQALRHRGPRC